MTLDTLLAHAHINRWDERVWFRNARLTGTVLFIPNRTYAGFVARAWGKDLRALLPGLTIRTQKETL